MNFPKEKLDYLNKRLEDKYGKMASCNLPNYRVCWSTDQFEKRKTFYSDTGMKLLRPEVRTIPKYRQWCGDRYLLERLFAIPDFADTDLVEPYSYENIWTFEDGKGLPLTPRLDACVFIIEKIHEEAAKGVGVKYKHPYDGMTTADLKEAKRKEIDNLVEALFPNETDTGDALAYREGVSVPSNYQGKEEK